MLELNWSRRISLNRAASRGSSSPVSAPSGVGRGDGVARIAGRPVPGPDARIIADGAAGGIVSVPGGCKRTIIDCTRDGGRAVSGDEGWRIVPTAGAGVSGVLVTRRETGEGGRALRSDPPSNSIALDADARRSRARRLVGVSDAARAKNPPSALLLLLFVRTRLATLPWWLALLPEPVLVPTSFSPEAVALPCP